MKEGEEPKKPTPKKSEKSVSSKKKKSTTSHKSPSGTPKSKKPPTPPPEEQEHKDTKIESPKVKAQTPPKPPVESVIVRASIQPQIQKETKSPVPIAIVRPQPQYPVCPGHGKPLTSFCESCEIPVCADCMYNGPHSTEVHRIVDIKEAFESRMEYLNSQIYEATLKKRELVSAQISRVDYRIGEIKSVSGIVEKDIKTEFSGMLERLKSTEGTKFAILQHDMATLQKDVERIDNLLNHVDEYAQGDGKVDYASFLSNYKEMQEYMQYAITKPFIEKIDVNSHDLAQELNMRKEMAAKSEDVERLFRLKDDIIMDIIQEKKMFANTSEEKMREEIVEEAKEWEKIVDLNTQEIMNYQMACSFCGQRLNDETVNSKCLTNREIVKTSMREKYTVEDPPADCFGTERHYFGKPVEKKLALMSKFLIDNTASRAFTAIKNGAKPALVEFVKALHLEDSAGKGYVHAQKFFEIVKKYFDMRDEFAERLAVALIAPPVQFQRIYYEEFIKSLNAGIVDTRATATTTAKQSYYQAQPQTIYGSQTLMGPTLRSSAQAPYAGDSLYGQKTQVGPKDPLSSYEFAKSSGVEAYEPRHFGNERSMAAIPELGNTGKNIT